jgi:hypothetical protein
MVLVGMGHDSSLKRNLVLAVPRVGLALILGIVVATPLTLQIFHKEIDTEIVQMQAERADAYRVGLESDARFADLPALRTRIQTAESVVASGGQTDAGLAVVQGSVAARQTELDAALGTQQTLEAKAQCELDGTCGTGDAGAGTAYQQARAAADVQAATVQVARNALDDARAAVSSAEATSVQQATGSLDTDQAELARLTAQQTRLQEAFDATNSGAGGILLRLEALDRLGNENATLWAAQLMLTLLFMSVEILPVLMKLLLNFSPPTAYDRLAALRDRTDIDVEELQMDARRQVERAQAELLVMAEQERVDRQKDGVRARREARLAAKVRASMAPSAVAQEPAREANTADTGRQLWDTGPMRLARSAAGRTVRSVRRRPGNRAVV